MRQWGRLITAMVTPFDADLNVDYKKAVQLANLLATQGTTALVVCGTTGESPTLSDEEKLALFKLLKSETDLPVIANIGTNCTRETIEFGKKAAACGVDGAMAVVPYYNKPNQECLYRHFKEVAAAVDLPIMLYNVPGRTGSNLSADTAIRLAEIDNIAALKEASGDLDQAGRIIKHAGSNITVYSGDDSLTLPMLSIGGYGIVSVASHIVGPLMKTMIESFVQGNAAEAARIHLDLLEVFKNLFITANPIPIKAALRLSGFDAGGLRLPLVEADEDLKSLLKKTLEQVGM